MKRIRKWCGRAAVVLVLALVLPLFACGDAGEATGDIPETTVTLPASGENELAAVIPTLEPTAEATVEPAEADCGIPLASEAYALPEGFVYTTDIAPDVVLEIRYYSTYNFVGARVDGYEAPVSIMTEQAAQAIKIASDILREQGYVLKIFDSYRPADAVAHFVRWGKDLEDTRMKAYFYPDVDKTNLFNGYISTRSGHSRGSTVDLTIIDMKTGVEVDMGGPFDFLGEISHHGTSLITAAQAANRLILKNAMEAAGFKAYSMEWWHYTLNNEPFPDTYFNFPVK